MFCTNCGKPMDDGAKFCPSCGAAVELEEEAATLTYDEIKTEVYEPDEAEEAYEEEPEVAPAPKKRAREQTAAEAVTPNIYLGADGVYRWTYEMSLYKNPTLFFLVLKIMLGIWTGIWLFTTILHLIDWGWSGMGDQLKIFLYFVIGIFVLCGLGYLLYALIMGGKYIVDFEMDPQKLVHIQSTSKKQRKKADAIATATVIAGALAGKPGVVGLGATAGARNSSTSEFSRLRKIIVYPRRGLIKLNGGGFNQAYVKPEDLDFVCSYLKQHVPDTVTWIEK